MSGDDDWRMELAREVARAYSADPAVAAVECGGSTARGCADAHSDVELGVFWHAAPSSAARAAAYDRTGGSAIERYAFDTEIGDHAEEFAVYGVKIDVSHRTVDATAQLLADLVERYDPAQRKQTVADALLHCVPLHGAALIAQWQTRAAAYPRGLAVAAVERHLRFGPQAWLAMLAERGDVLPLYQHFGAAQQQLVALLYGLNRRYHPGFKWLQLRLPELALAPPLLYDRLVALFHAEPTAAVAELGQLLAETLALVERELPEVDLAPARARITRRRPLHPTSPLPHPGIRHA